jgi:hypothetical protein
MRTALVLVVTALVASGFAAAKPLRVVVNGVALPPATVRALEHRLGVDIRPGAYWYDRRSGAFGAPGGPTSGFVLAGLRVGGPLSPHASGRHATRVFVNGRELHPVDVRALTRLLGPVPHGRYWLDGRGNYGLEGRAAIGNLIRIAHSSGYQTSTYGGYIGSDGKTSYYFDPDSGCSVSPGDGVSC